MRLMASMHGDAATRTREFGRVDPITVNDAPTSVPGAGLRSLTKFSTLPLALDTEVP